MTADSIAYGRHRVPGTARTVAARALLGCAATAAVAAWSAHTVITSTTPHTALGLLTLGATALLAGTTTWLAVLLMLSALSTLPGSLGVLAHEALRSLAPHTVGALLTVALGAGFSSGHLMGQLPGAEAAAGPTATSTATLPDDTFADDGHEVVTPPSPAVRAATDATVGTFGTVTSRLIPAAGTADVASVTPGWTPERPSPRPLLPHADLRILGGGRAPAAEITVRAGDTLWDIVGRHLGARATPAAIAAELPRWHAANLHVIGPSMDTLRPGQVLTPPTTAQ